MQRPESDTAFRSEARAFEKALPPAQRKELGQFFTGMPLGRILVHLAVNSDIKSILDPMAGSGDLLDAAREAAITHGVKLERLDAVEIDEATASLCERRLRRVCDPQVTALNVICGDAFSPDTLDSIADSGYDLIITNPPYVRYQSLSGRRDDVRRGLLAIVDRRLSDSAQIVWRALSNGYSGLSDLSIPAWLLSALLVRPGGYLALVVPATWRTRAYADVVQYLMLRSFQLELIVEDTQPGWFSDALVRTHLIVARRLPEDQVAKKLSERPTWPAARWVQVAPEAASSESLVSGAFPGNQPEAKFREWCRASEQPDPSGIRIRTFSLENEWLTLRAQAAGRPWMKTLEGSVTDQPLFTQSNFVAVSVPEALRDLLPPCFDGQALRPLDDVGIRTGQGLRTGCNRFFYVTSVDGDDGMIARVKTNPALGGHILSVPVTVLRPVLHRQVDLEAWRNGLLPATRVLDLRRMILPDDMEIVRSTIAPGGPQSDDFPAVMPNELAAHVREAGKTSLGSGEKEQPIAAMSAVKTNARPARGGAMPRFWYMLPDFMPRHLPQAFVPRIIHGGPKVHANTEPPVLIDANFSTFWTDRGDWTPAALTAFLNSTWCRAIMEAVGTPLAGGALKLEAVNLRKMPVPHLDSKAIKSLNDAGQCAQDAKICQHIDRIVLGAVLNGNASEIEIDAIAEGLNERRVAMRAARQRGGA